MQDFYPVLGCGVAPGEGEDNYSQHPHWIENIYPICSISRFGNIFPAIFLGLSQVFPREPPS